MSQSFSDNIPQKFGQRVQVLRKEANLSQMDLAVKVGVDIRQVQRVEKGEVNTSVTMASKLAKALGVEVGALFEG